ncbi:MAG: adenylosuccinate lyase [Bacteroidales bacterium]
MPDIVSTFALQNISPIDGRYARITWPLAAFFSEEALMRYRVKVEVEYFISLCRLPLPQLKNIDKTKLRRLREAAESFSTAQALRVKEIEQTTNHDVKAVEYFLRELFDHLELSEYKEFIHFGLTSQDINNTAQPLALRDALEKVIRPALRELLSQMEAMAREWKDLPMLAHTHGQPASPTTLGKELWVFAERLQKQLSSLNFQMLSAKFGGATGNFNAHKVAYPDIDWITFADTFVNDVLGLERQQTTTQIEHYDDLASVFDNFSRINTILLDLSRDMWLYISMGYFRQKVKEGEVGSSAMPHKVNPIDFENAEGNLGIANALFEHLARKLPVSRLQRDLTDSTVMRNVGVPFAHSLIAYKSLLKGLEKVYPDPQRLSDDLEANWAVVAEAIQTILRREGYLHPYEALKQLTRTGKPVDKETIYAFIQSLEVNDAVKQELLAITPHNYLGIIRF